MSAGGAFFDIVGTADGDGGSQNVDVTLDDDGGKAIKLIYSHFQSSLVHDPTVGLESDPTLAPTTTPTESPLAPTDSLR